jgi:Holliday junction resolvase
VGAKSQRKGRSGEIELVKILNNNGISAETGQAVSFGSTPDIVGVDGVHAEVKRVERLNILEAMNQAIRDSEKFDDGLPTLFHRRNRSPWLVTMTLEDWLKIYRGWRS